MCGISGIISLGHDPIPDLAGRLRLMNRLQAHRGPDGEGVWTHPSGRVGFGHRRLSIIDLAAGGQPMEGPGGSRVTYNGEIYNYVELRRELGPELFRTQSDTEVLLHAWNRHGADCLERFKGMFAFALWDEEDATLFCARDRFGIKPFHYARVGDALYFASEAKALLPFLDGVDTDPDALKEYLTFQFCLNGHTLFKGVRQLRPGHCLTVRGGAVTESRYWDVTFQPDFEHTPEYFERVLRERLEESVRLHLRSDVPVGAYVSGGLDSGVVASLACDHAQGPLAGFTGKFSRHGERFDESRYARTLAASRGFELHEIDIEARDFTDNLAKVVFHLDYPLAGPGAFPQYMVSSLAARHRKVVLGGQGGDEIFGGYTRYLIAYFEQCIKAAIEGTGHSGRFIVTYESIIPNLRTLAPYKPLLKQFWSKGLFEDMDRRYFDLINRAPDLGDEVRWEALGSYCPFRAFQDIFHGPNVKKKASYFDLMTHFDFKTLLPALLHVEDRVSMAHGLEARVPLLDHELVEVAATIPSDVKFKDGTMKHVFKQVIAPWLPREILERQDKMGFPTPLVDWIQGDAADFVRETLSTSRALARDYVDNRRVLDQVGRESQFGRKIWGLLCLEIWQQAFHDREAELRAMAREPAAWELN